MNEARFPLLASLSLLTLTISAHAHPVPRQNHDRTLLVRLTPDKVIVVYRLEVDPKWAVYELTQIKELERDLDRASSEGQLYALYRRYHEKPIAYNLVAHLDGKPLTFRCSHGSELLLDHLRCEYVFEAPCDATGDRPHHFTLIDANYTQDRGQFRATVTAGPGVALTEVRGPTDQELNATSTWYPVEPKAMDKPALPPEPATVKRPPRRPPVAKPAATAPVAVVLDKPPPSEEEKPAPAKRSGEENHLLALLLDSKQGFWLLLLLSAGFGAAHALTPGHGKTLVAAYLVGERGTTWHALILGLATTFSHTAVVLLLAALLPIFYPGGIPPEIAVLLGVIGGLLIAGLGFWLLLCRVSGQADHIHLGGGHHHHHHEHQHEEPKGPKEGPGWWRLIVLGVSGGIVPCWDALLMLCFAISVNRLWLGLPLLLAFSAGLASVLVAFGLVVVYGKNYLGAKWGESPRLKRLFAALPILSAVIVTGLGLWLCYASVHGR